MLSLIYNLWALIGIDIDGNCSSFVQKLSAKGFTLKKNIETGGAIMNGTFTGKDVEVYISHAYIQKGQER